MAEDAEISLSDAAAEDRPRKIGLLFVHGMGEQEPLAHLDTSAREFAFYLARRRGLIRLSVEADYKHEHIVVVDAVTRSGAADGPQQRAYIHMHEVFWADLGIKGGLLEQVKFWLWGLGQWSAFAVRRGNPGRNTEKLMAMPRFAEQQHPMDQPGLIRQIPARAMLFIAGMLAFLTLFSWSVAKRVVGFLAQRIPHSSLIFLFLGDVKNYAQSATSGQSSLIDPDHPMRATIRRRMVRKMVAMASADCDEWYVFAHSLGTVPAFNALQETELALPNYLEREEWEALPAGLKTVTPFVPESARDKPPTTDNMMPRRPPWLEDHDGIDRVKLFERFRGFVTFGAPLDKFAAMWPRVVCLNLQAAVFPSDSEWINLHDPTDPVSARLDAFAPPEQAANAGSDGPKGLAPVNFATRSSLLFGLSHIRYFVPRRQAAGTMAAAIFGAVVAGDSLAVAAREATMSSFEAWARAFAALVQVVVLALLLAAASAVLLIMLGKALPDQATGWMIDAITWLCPALADMLRGGLKSQLVASVALILAAAFGATLLAGLARFIADATKPQRR